MEQSPVNEFVKWADTVRWMRWSRVSRAVILEYQNTYYMFDGLERYFMLAIITVLLPVWVTMTVIASDIDLTIPPEYNDYVQYWKNTSNSRNRKQP